jgi:membrane-bound lytic murein transglycosylase MltF
MQISESKIRRIRADLGVKSPYRYDISINKKKVTLESKQSLSTEQVVKNDKSENDKIKKSKIKDKIIAGDLDTQFNNSVNTESNPKFKPKLKPHIAGNEEITDEVINKLLEDCGKDFV